MYVGASAKVIGRRRGGRGGSGGRDAVIIIGRDGIGAGASSSFRLGMR